jgi:hypothetical protein
MHPQRPTAELHGGTSDCGTSRDAPVPTSTTASSGRAPRASIFVDHRGSSSNQLNRDSSAPS